MDITLAFDSQFYLNIFSIISFSIIFASHIDPLEVFKRKIGMNYNGKLRSKIWIINLIIQFFKKVFNCSGCLSFWLSLILIRDIRISLIIYCITFYLSTRINSIQL